CSARIADLGETVLGGSPADFAKPITEETEKWAKVVKFSGAKVDGSGELRPVLGKSSSANLVESMSGAGHRTNCAAAIIWSRQREINALGERRADTRSPAGTATDAQGRPAASDPAA